MSTPQTRICICNNVGLTNEYKHTIFFSDLSEQSTFFEGKVAKTFSDYTYTRKNWELKVGASFATASSWSYLFFKNPNDAKTYYYFINDVQYVSDNTVKLVLELDVMQTYMFDYNLSPCFVEREHSATDQIGDNTVEEDLELGHYTCYDSTTSDFDSLQCVMIMTTLDLSKSNFPRAVGHECEGIYTGCNIYAIEWNDQDIIQDLLSRVDSAGKSDAILTMWMYPREHLTFGDSYGSLHLVKGSADVNISSMKYLEKPTKIGTYTPKNKKLLTYPFVYLYVTNHTGNTAIYRYERFQGDIDFLAQGSMYPDGGMLISPVKYNGSAVCRDEKITLGSFPTCAWSSDTYKLWLAQNQSQHALTMTQGAITAGAGALTAVVGTAMLNPAMMAGGVGGVVSGASTIASLMAQKSDMERMPPQAHGSVSSTLLASNLMHNLLFMSKGITVERARMIDDYFTLYGYALKRVKVPNRNVRESFTYTKTVGCHISGNICTSDKVKIESIYDRGITFWNKNETVGNYQASNKPLSEVT